MGKGEFHPLVVYGARTQKDGEILYSSLKRRYLPYPHGSYVNESYPAVFSYGLLTLQADSLLFDPRTKSITALGDVTLQNGVQTQHASKVSIEFAKGDPVVKVIQ
ncbi:MAG TPA: hypothetical protein VJN90_03040 [Candidatus Acidoferrales bacterium]|nr:hypothetical protein [Candidatus Acidoferrales bacterium]